MTIPEWITDPKTVLGFVAGVLAVVVILWFSPRGQRKIRAFLGIEEEATAAAQGAAAAALRGPPVYTVELEVDAAHPPPRLFLRTLMPSRIKGETWETFNEREITPQRRAAGGGAGRQDIYSFEVRAGEIVQWLFNQDMTLPFKPFLTVPAATLPHYRNALCQGGHTVTGAGDALPADPGQRRIWFLFSGGRLHPASTLVYELNHAV